MPARRYMEKTGLGCRAGCREDNSGESQGTSADKASHSGFETQGHQQKSKSGVSVSPQKGLCPPKVLKKEKQESTPVRCIPPAC